MNLLRKKKYQFRKVVTEFSLFFRSHPRGKCFIFSVECGEDWLTFDNSCYKVEPGAEMQVSFSDGQNYCAQAFNADLMVPNFAEEAAFIGSYLKAVEVKVVRMKYQE